MKFLIDQDVYAITVSFLKQLGHDVVCVADIGYSSATDSELLGIAQEQERILITRDRDFVRLVFADNVGKGVIYLRIIPSNLYEIHEELKLILSSYSEKELKNAFVVVEPRRHRIRRLT